MAAPVARPGMLNYVEGQVTIDGHSMGSKSVGQTEVEPGQILTTQQGRAEMLLTPGVFLRLSDHSAARMVSPSLTDTRVELLQGEALVEAQDVRKENRIDVIDHGVGTLLEKKGIYRFDADHPMVAVFDGKAKVLTNDEKGVELGKGKELALNTGGELKGQKFDRDQVDSLYQWSKLRSEYDAQANAASARTIMLENPGWYYGTGWYWNPWYSSWAFVPGAGFGYSPFGFGFYSPGYLAYGRPFYGYRGAFRGGFRGAPMVVRPGRAIGGGGAVHLGRGARM
uniref:FecR protein domain-containing protein n=1 Tax=Solibacter usitatus (strain Ellin6076) TaxID=234267 RepID=Q01QB8_SOLUE